MYLHVSILHIRELLGVRYLVVFSLKDPLLFFIFFLTLKESKYLESTIVKQILKTRINPNQKAVNLLTPTTLDRLRNNVNKQLLWN